MFMVPILGGNRGMIKSCRKRDLLHCSGDEHISPTGDLCSNIPDKNLSFFVAKVEAGNGNFRADGDLFEK